MIPEGKYPAFAKIPRLNREVIVTEKIDGTNGLILVNEDGSIHAGSRNRWLTPDADNFGFAAWVAENAGALVDGLGVGHHFGEWYGAGIQRRYGLTEKRFALFNTGRWAQDDAPWPCRVVPILTRGEYAMSGLVYDAIRMLRDRGSCVSDDYFREAEGVVAYHTASRSYFKVTLEDDAKPKGVAA